jgi:anti-anti-sigma factor
VGTSSAASSRGFRLTTEVENGIVILYPEGRLTLEFSQDFKSQVKAMLTTPGHVLLDMSGVTYVDSSGLGAVVSVYTSAKAIGCKFQICNMMEPVKKIFGLTRVLDAFESCGAYMSKMP